MFKKENTPIISFASLLPGLRDIPGASPYPAIQGIPSWWKEVPRKVKEGPLTVKTCPSFVDYFSQGFILPAWEDAILKYDSDADYWNVATQMGNTDTHRWSIHGTDQFLGHVDVSVNNLKPTMVFKADSPWRIFTKPGWSVLQVPLFYHFDNNFTALPGIIDTDIVHEANVQLLYFGNGEDIKIKRGQPLVQYIPFKREKHSFDVRDATEKDIEKYNKSRTALYTKFMGSGSYRAAQKHRDKN
jgi:hypothetical protein